MTEYTPDSWSTGDTFEAADATAMSQQIDEEEELNKTQTAALAGKQPLDANLTALAALTTPATKLSGIATGADVTATALAPAVHAATAKTTLADADELPLVDSAASNVLKRITWANVTVAIETLIGNYETETLALINRMTVRPDATHRSAINTLIGALKTAGIWTKLDGLHLLAAHTQQAALLNWVTSARDLTAFNSPTFTADRGIAGDGSTSYLGMSASFAGSSLVRMVNNSESLGVWTRTNQAIDAVYGVSLGTSSTGTSTDRYINPRAVSTAIIWRADTATQTSPTHATSDNTFTAWSHNATDAYLYFNGAQDDTFTGAFTNDPSTLSLFLVMGRAGAVYSTRQHGGVFYGGYLTSGEHAILYNAMFDYMTALGAV